MAWRYRKRIKIAPGVNVNVSKRGVSTSIGTRGASVNVGKNGAYLNTGIPGTGLYNRQKISGSHEGSKNEKSSPENKGCLYLFLSFLFVGFAIYVLINYAKTSDPALLLGGLLSTVFGIVFFVLVGKDSDKSKAATTLVRQTEETSRRSNVYTPPTVLPTEMYCGKYDPLFMEAAKLVVTSGRASTSAVQRMFALGYNRAGRIMDELELNGIVGPANGAVPREVLVEDLAELFLITNKMEEESSNGLSVAKECCELTEDQFNLIKKEAYELNDFLMMISRKINVRREIDAMFQIHDEDGIPMKVSDKVKCIILADVYRCFKGLGHDFTIDDDEENIGIYLFMCEYLKTGVEITYTSRSLLQQKTKGAMSNVLKMVDILNMTAQIPANEFFLQKVLGEYNRDMQSQYMVHLYRFASAVANADGEINEDEKRWLSDILKSKESVINDGSNVKKTDSSNVRDVAEKPNEELDSLIGLSSVKEEITRLTNFIKIQQVREQQGLKTSAISYHCVFTGNPGTGKTTVARIIAGIYKELGILKNGHLIETDRSGLVAEYVGQTAVKTNKIIDSALDGVLFIDEAYSLVQGAKEDYGQEAISTLLKRMEDDRERLVVILAGYGNEMKEFIDSNPGLQSRFNRYINFPDYDADELLSIFKKNLETHQYNMTDEAESFVRSMLIDAVANKDNNFGNARFVRNLFEKTLENQAMRLASATGKLTSEMLCEIGIEDVVSLK